MSEIHKMSVRSHRAIEKSEAAKAIITLNEKNSNKWNVYLGLHTHVSSNTNHLKIYVWICDIIESSGKDTGTNYRIDKQAKLFMTYMARNVTNDIGQKVLNSPYFALTCNSATDFSVKEQESIRIRLAFNGLVSDHLIAFESPGANANADGIFEALCRGTNKVGITNDVMKAKITSIALNGASVNTGRHHSVVTLCKKVNSAVMPVHCFSHRLELAFWNTAKSMATFKKVYTLLQGLYNFYHLSGK